MMRKNQTRKQKKRSASRRHRRETAKKFRTDMLSFLSGFDIEQYREKARSLDRKFVLHIGPTNSGKTYDAIQALKAATQVQLTLDTVSAVHEAEGAACRESAGTGAYLGPLRLLALEMYDSLNEQGIPCELLTGEEYIYTEDARVTASTIELCNFNKRYDVVVIDEAQLISDPHRGGSWTKAIFLVDAAEIHICASNDAEELLCKILSSFDADYTIHRHERLAPLIYRGQMDSIDQVEDGDAVIVFSRRAVLATAAELEKKGKHVSVIYGALPPASRREEVRKFASGENTIVVSTDAIGMGISLPIKRIIFRELTKFDGEESRILNGSEIRQIAGRAGRYGIYDRGEVYTMAEAKAVKKALGREGRQLQDIVIPFPREAIDTGFFFDKLFDEWQRLPIVPGFAREDMSEAAYLYNFLGGKLARKLDRSLLYELITCPVDIKNEQLVYYWLECCIAISFESDRAYGDGPQYSINTIEEPDFDTEDLEGCELQYKALDVRHQILRRIGVEDPKMDEKLELCKKINRLLMKDKKGYQRYCRRCGRPLPATHPYGICDRCFRKYRR